jgi:hypothetical protein
MVRHRTAAPHLSSTGPVRELAGQQTCPTARRRSRRRSSVDDADDALVVRVRLCEGPLELRVPRAAVKAGRHDHRHHIAGFNADATPC